MKESEHDEVIAPALMRVMQDVADRGGKLLAYSSYVDAEGGKGFTSTAHVPEPSAHEQIIHLAILCKGNIDSLLIELLRRHRRGEIDVSQSIFLGPRVMSEITNEG